MGWINNHDARAGGIKSELVYQLSVEAGISLLVGIFDILFAQSDCPLSEILYYHLGEGVSFTFSHIFPLPSFTGLFVVHLIACKILFWIEPIVTV